MPEQDNNEFQEIMNQLIALGEDRAELDFWKKAFAHLNAEEQQELLKMLKDELTQLTN